MNVHYAGGYIMLDDCVEWEGSKNGRGYGETWIDGQRWRAHRRVWTLAHGPIPEGMLICHHCDNPSCINVDHLFMGTPADNSRDMVEKERHGRSRLTEKDVIAILNDPRPDPQIAKDYGVGYKQINHIRLGKRWKHVSR